MTTDIAPPPDLSLSTERLLQAVGPRLKRVFFHFHIPPEDSDDLLQDALLSLISTSTEVRSPEEWLLGAVRNQCRHFWRSRSRRLYDAVDSAVLEAAGVASAQERRDVLQDLRNTIAKLPSRCRTILSLRYAQGYNSVEVAGRLGFGPAAARKALERCLSALAREMTGSATSGSPEEAR